MTHIYKSTFRFTTLSPFSKQQYRKAKHIITHIIENPESYEFREPVNWQALNLLDYTTLIPNPMDLGTVLANLNEEKYQNVEEFLDDTELIWDNCKSYNIKGSWIYSLADKLQKNCKKMLKNYFPSIPLVTVKKQAGAAAVPNPQPTPVVQQIPYEPTSNSEIRYTPEPISRPLPKSKKIQKERVSINRTEKLYYQDEQEITTTEKQRLADKFRYLCPQDNRQLVDYIRISCPTALRELEERLQVLVDHIDIITFKQILEKAEEIQAESSGRRVKFE